MSLRNINVRRNRNRKELAIACVASGLLASACGGASGSSATSSSTTTTSSTVAPVTTTIPPPVTTTTAPPVPGVTMTYADPAGYKAQLTMTFGAPVLLSQVSQVQNVLSGSCAGNANTATAVVVPAQVVMTNQSSLQETQLFKIVASQYGDGSNQIWVVGLSAGPTCLPNYSNPYVSSETYGAQPQISANQSSSLSVWFVYLNALTPNAPTVNAQSAALSQFPVDIAWGLQPSGTGATGLISGPRVATCGNGSTLVVPSGPLPRQYMSNGAVIQCTPTPTPTPEGA